MNNNLKKSFDEYIGKDPLVTQKDKDTFINTIQIKKIKRRKRYVVPNLLTAILLLGLAATVYMFLQPSSDTNQALSVTYDNLDELFNNAELVVKGNLLEGYENIERNLTSQVVQERLYKVEVEEVVQNKTLNSIQAGDIVTISTVLSASFNGHEVDLNEAENIETGNYLLFLNRIEDQTKLTFVNHSPNHLYMQVEYQYKNINGHSLKVIKEEDIVDYLEVPTLDDLLANDSRLEDLYLQLNDHLLKIWPSDGYYVKKAAESTILYLYGMYTGKQHLVEKYVQAPEIYQTQKQIRESLDFYKTVNDFDVNVVEMEPSRGDPVVTIAFNYTNGQETIQRIVLLEAYENIYFSESPVLKPFNLYGFANIDKNLVKNNAEIGLSKEEVEERFGFPFVGKEEDLDVWLYDEINEHYYGRNVETVAQDEIKSGNLDYQLFVVFNKDKAIKYAYYYLGDDGKVWEYSINPETINDKPISK